MWEVLNASLKESIKVEETSPSDAMHQSRKGKESSSTQQKRRRKLEQRSRQKLRKGKVNKAEGRKSTGQNPTVRSGEGWIQT